MGNPYEGMVVWWRFEKLPIACRNWHNCDIMNLKQRVGAEEVTMKVTRQQVEKFVAEHGREFGVSMDDIEFVGMDTVLSGIRWGVVADTPEEAIAAYFRSVHFDTAYWRKVYIRRYGE